MSSDSDGQSLGQFRMAFVKSKEVKNGRREIFHVLFLSLIPSTFRVSLFLFVGVS